MLCGSVLKREHCGDGCIWRMFVFMFVVVTLWEPVGMFVV